MKKISYIVLAIVVMSGLLFSKDAMAWDHKGTHKELSKIAAEQSVLENDRGNYLARLGFTKGLLETLEWNGTKNYVKDWIQSGAKREDYSQRR